ncbi:MAG: 4-hydroxy-tetrahydrodipicolinate reductase [Bacteroidaceae bacterium]|nr:4-hydroxy-tetrahydrodipicolinate reductase [Bacteroidaceae bacterium]
MKIALIGYGKMGQMIEQLALQRGHKVVCIIDIHNQEDFNSAAFRSADVAIEFTTPTAAYNNIIRCFENDIKVVTGSTGWQKEHWEEICERCKYGLQTLFWSSNFSLGVFLFNRLNKQLARMMAPYPNYKPSIEETHHVHKLDAPSGTAITLAETLVANYPGLKTEQLPIKSIREGEVPGIHSVIYDSEYDEIKITHCAKSRGGFVLGAVLAAEYAYTHSGLLTMEDLFNQRD